LFFLYGLQYKSIISNWLTFASVIGGIFSNIFIGGYICDKYDSKYLRTKSIVASLSLLGAAIMYFLEYYLFVNVWLAMIFVTVQSFLFEGCTPPIVSMMANTSGAGKSPVMALMMVTVGTA